MALIYSKKPCVLAGTFTSNVVKAAPVKWDQNVVEHSEFGQAVVVNAGIANACTGKEGMAYCSQTAKKAGELLHIPEEAVLVASTGVIGMQLPMDRIEMGIEKLVRAKSEALDAGTQAAEAIMTTDTHSKQVAAETEIGGVKVTIGGMSKGSGMIHPNMCTMLAFVTTDAVISKELLTKLVKEDVKDTFNMISVDGDTSTNDTLLVMANGMAENPEITTENEDYEIFKEALYKVLMTLTKMLAKDGEGASKMLECTCSGAPDQDTAIIVAKSVIRSPLFKCAMFGEDANWGRILCAIGYAQADFDIRQVDVDLASAKGCVAVCRKGAGVDFSEEEAKKILGEDEIYINIDLHQGEASAKAWGCDLTYDYVKINGDYRS